MENEAKQYELICILSPQLEGTDLDAFRQFFEKIVADNKGQVIHFMEPEKHELVYPINKQSQGIYLIAHISLEPENVSVVSRELKTNKNLLRSLITIIETPSEKRIEKLKKTIKKPAPSTRRRQAGPQKPENSSGDDKVKLEEIDKKLNELVGL